MNLTKLLSIGALFYFHFDLAHGTYSKLDNLYREKVLREKENDIVHRVCHQTLLEWVNYCQYAYASIRKDYSEYYNWLYVDYFAFIRERESKCEKIILVLSTGELVTQYILPCFGSSLVVSSDPQSSPVTYVSDIAIYPADNDTSVLVLKEIQNVPVVPTNPNANDNSTQYLETAESIIKNYHLLEIYSELKIWDVVGAASPLLLFHPRPQSTKLSHFLEDDDVILNAWKYLYDGRNNNNSILNQVDINGFLKLCSWVYGQEKYKNEFCSHSVRPVSENVEQQSKNGLFFLHNIHEVDRVEQLKKSGLLSLRTKNTKENFEVEMYGCYLYYNGYAISEYSISP